MIGRAPKLVAGAGNLLLRDDGVGPRAIEALARLPLPEDVELHDTGTTGFGAVSILENRDLVVVIDAMDGGREPGAILRTCPGDLRPAMRGGLSLHDGHLLDALAVTRLLGTEPRRVVILGVQIADVSAGVGLSPAVKDALPGVVRHALRELEPRQEPGRRLEDAAPDRAC